MEGFLYNSIVMIIEAQRKITHYKIKDIYKNNIRIALDKFTIDSSNDNIIDKYDYVFNILFKWQRILFDSKDYSGIKEISDCIVDLTNEYDKNIKDVLD